MRNFQHEGDKIPIVAPSGGTVSGRGLRIGTHLFGVAIATVAEGGRAVLQVEGVVEMAKTSALAIAIGDLVYWDATNNVVNKTASAQKLVGIAVSAAADPSATVMVKLIPNGVAVAA